MYNIPKGVMKVKEISFEIFKGNLLIRELKSWKAFEKALNKYKLDLLNDGYSSVQSSTAGYHLFFNPRNREQDAVCLYWRIWLGIYDCNGNKIYENDQLEDKSGNRCFVSPYNLLEDKAFFLHIYRPQSPRSSFYRSEDIPITGQDVLDEYGVHVVKGVFDTL
jgi:hypothetical protein